MNQATQIFVYAFTFSGIAIIVFVYDLIFGSVAILKKKYTLTIGKYNPKSYNFTGQRAVFIGVTRLVRGILALCIGITPILLIKQNTLELLPTYLSLFVILLVINSAINLVLVRKTK